MSSQNPLKILEICGKIEPEVLSYAEKWEKTTYLSTEYCDFSQGLWLVAAKDLSYQSVIAKPFDHNQLDWFEKFFSISTNYVQGQYTQTCRRIPIPIAKFRYQEWGNQLVNFAPNWFEINSPSRSLQINLEPWIPVREKDMTPLMLINGFEFKLTLMFKRLH